MVENAETTGVAGRPYEQWISELKNFESGAWDILLKFYAADLRHDIIISLRKRNLPEELVDDIEQETWLTAIRKFGEFVWENEEKFHHWLRAIYLNHIHSYRRLDRRNLRIEDFLHESDADLEQFVSIWGQFESSSEEETIRQELYAALDQTLRILKPREQELLVRWLTGEAPRELARVYNMKPRTVSMILLRAKDKIKANFKHFDDWR